jgi:hypothetical protein
MSLPVPAVFLSIFFQLTYTWRIITRYLAPRIIDALINGAFRGYYYWIMEPIGLLLVTRLAFALVGFALDRVFNSRLRNL